VSRRLREIRDARGGLSQSQLALTMREDLGVPMDRAVLANLEASRRQSITVEQLFGLAAALNVSPTNLLLPTENEAEYAVTPKVRTFASHVRAWLHEAGPLPGVRYSGDYYRDVEDFLRFSTPGRRRELRIGRDPIIAAVATLMTHVRAALDRKSPDRLQDDVRYPRLLAEALRREAQRLNAYVNLLADELEREAKEEERAGVDPEDQERMATGGREDHPEPGA